MVLRDHGGEKIPRPWNQSIFPRLPRRIVSRVGGKMELVTE